MEVLPAAQAGAGEMAEAEADVARLSAHIDDVTDSGKGEMAELLRPFYLDYLQAPRRRGALSLSSPRMRAFSARELLLGQHPLRLEIGQVLELLDAVLGAGAGGGGRGRLCRRRAS